MMKDYSIKILNKVNLPRAMKDSRNGSTPELSTIEDEYEKQDQALV
jgi:hypothetical protein